MILNLLDADRLKRAEAHVECEFGSFDSAFMQPAQDFRREVKPRRRRRHRAALAGVDGLVAFAIPLAVCPCNVRRQGHVTESFDDFEKIVYTGEADAPLPKSPAAEHFRLEIVLLPKKEMLTHADFSTWPGQAF